MTDASTVRDRVRSCFEIALPSLPPELLETVRKDAVDEWDSLASLTLIAVLEEEFGLIFDDTAVDSFTSFDAVVDTICALGG